MRYNAQLFSFHFIISSCICIVCVQSLLDFIRPSLALAQYALCPPSDEPAEEEEESHPRPLLQHFMNPELLKEYQSPQFERATSTGPENWIEEFQLMNLPLFTTQYVQLVHVPLDVMHECLQLQLELRPPQKPSPHSVRQVLQCCVYLCVLILRIFSWYVSVETHWSRLLSYASFIGRE